MGIKIECEECGCLCERSDDGTMTPVENGRIAELERERIDSQAQLMVERRELLAKLAAAQATIQRKDEALKSIRDTALYNFSSDRSAILHFKAVADEAIALPADRTALDAMLAEAEKRGMLKADGICEPHEDDDQLVSPPVAQRIE